MKDRDNIEFSGVSKSIDDRYLFKHLQLNLTPGECIVLSGDNGEGKTTLLRIMSGLLHPDVANCQYNGVQHSWQRARHWLLKNVVYLHQDPYLFDTSVEANISYGLRRRGMRGKAARAMATDALQRTGLAHLQQRSGKQLSGGERQRVALLRAWVLSPRLLLLDEPVASMDERARHTTLFLIRWLLQDGVGIIITAHEPRLFAALADRHLRLHAGELSLAPELLATTVAGSDSFSEPGIRHEGQQYQT